MPEHRPWSLACGLCRIVASLLIITATVGTASEDDATTEPPSFEKNIRFTLRHSTQRGNIVCDVFYWS